MSVSQTLFARPGDDNLPIAREMLNAKNIFALMNEA